MCLEVISAFFFAATWFNDCVLRFTYLRWNCVAPDMRYSYMFSLQIIISGLLLKISLELYASHVLPSLFFVPRSQKSRRWLQGWPSPKPHTMNNPPNKNPLKSPVIFFSLICFWWSDQIWHFLVKKYLKAYQYKSMYGTLKWPLQWSLWGQKQSGRRGRWVVELLADTSLLIPCRRLEGDPFPTVAAPHVVRSSHFH